MTKESEIIVSEINTEAQRIVEDSLYSARSHFEASRVWGWLYTVLGLPIAIVSAISGISVISQDYDLAMGLAFTVSILTAISSFLNVAKRQQDHKQYGSQYLALRNDAHLFSKVGIQTTKSLQGAATALEKLNETRNRLNDEAPDIPRWAYSMAKTNIERGEAEHESD